MREIGHAPTLGFSLTLTDFTRIFCGDYVAATTQCDELLRLSDEKGAAQLRAFEMLLRGRILVLTNKAVEAVKSLTFGLTAYDSTGGNLYVPSLLPYLARAHAELGQFEDAGRRIGEALTAVERTKERLWEAEVHRVAGEIALMLPEPDAAKAGVCFERALGVAREHQAKSWELRAAMSMARLWRDQGRRQLAHDLLAPIYGWFTEGFDTPVLQDAKALLDELA